VAADVFEKQTPCATIRLDSAERRHAIRPRPTRCDQDGAASPNKAIHTSSQACRMLFCGRITTSSLKKLESQNPTT
jgi:hypothetical protein